MTLSLPARYECRSHLAQKREPTDCSKTAAWAHQPDSEQDALHRQSGAWQHLLVSAGGDLLQEVGHSLAQGAAEAHGQEEGHHCLPGAAEGQLPLAQQHDIIEQIVHLPRQCLVDRARKPRAVLGSHTAHVQRQTAELCRSQMHGTCIAVHRAEYGASVGAWSEARNCQMQASSYGRMFAVLHAGKDSVPRVRAAGGT